MKRINFFYLVLSQKVDGKPNENTSFFGIRYTITIDITAEQNVNDHLSGNFESVVRLVKTMMELDQE
jgi:hypothetical protein